MSFPSCSFAHCSSKKNKWTLEEDEKLRIAVQACGTGSWNKIAVLVPLRTGKQCRERWMAQLAPSLCRDTWAPDEDTVLLRHHAAIGNRWTTIAAQLPGRSPLHVKNRWKWLIRHNRTAEHPSDEIASPADVLERKQTLVFEPINFDDGLFGMGFRQFQAKMMTN
jgi:hypothetical protein